MLQSTRLVAAVAHLVLVRRMLTLTQKPSRRSCAGKVTIIELLWVTLLIGGGVFGVRVGYVWSGFWGAVVGLPLGLAMGLLVSCGIAFLLNTFLPKPRNTKDESFEDG